MIMLDRVTVAQMREFDVAALSDLAAEVDAVERLEFGPRQSFRTAFRALMDNCMYAIVHWSASAQATLTVLPLINMKVMLQGTQC